MTDQTTTSVEPQTTVEPRAAFVPRYEIRRTTEGLLLLAEMPGVAADAVDVTLEQDVLRVHGRFTAPEREGYRLEHAEYREGDFESSFQLREEIDADGIRASLKSGLLRVELPRRRPDKKTISVKSE